MAAPGKRRRMNEGAGNMTDDNFSIDENLFPSICPVEVALLCSYEVNYLVMEVARHWSISPGIKVTVLVPECDLASLSLLKENSKEYAHEYRVVKAKKRPGFDGPLDCLLFPPPGFKTDIVVGMSRKLNGIAQLWKEYYHCESVCVDSGDLLCDVEERNIQPPSECLEMFPEADVNVAIGRKMHEKLSRDLRYYNKQVFNLTPGIISDFSNVSHGDVKEKERKTHVLVVGSDDPNCFEEEGLDIAAKAVAQNGKSCRLTFIGAARNKSQLTEKFLNCGVAKGQLDFQSLPRGTEDWKILLSRVDLAIMPSGLKGFGLEALFALSAGLPVLVHAESGFGEALREVEFGTLAIVDSDDAAVWAKEIKKVRETDKKIRLEQATKLRKCYDEKYSWEKQCGELLNMMVKKVSA